MRFHLKNQEEVNRAAEYLSTLAARDNIVDIKRVSYKRSLSQNSYLHLLLSYFGSQAGYTTEEAKEVYKRVSPQIFRYTKSNREFWRSSADLDTIEMTKSIDAFRAWSAGEGIDLPSANDQEFLKWAQDMIEQNAGYL